MKSYQHEVEAERLRYANLSGYEIRSLSETGYLQRDKIYLYFLNHFFAFGL